MTTAYLSWNESIAYLTIEELRFLETASADDIIEQLKNDRPYVVVQKLLELFAHGATEKAIQADKVSEIHLKWSKTMFENDIWIAFALMALGEFYAKEGSA